MEGPIFEFLVKFIGKERDQIVIIFVVIGNYILFSQTPRERYSRWQQDDFDLAIVACSGFKLSVCLDHLEPIVVVKAA